MRTVSEFANATLTQALKTKAALEGEGKSPEEVQQGLGETFKMEGDKLKYFMSALDVAKANPENLKRVLVMSLNEGERVPPKATKVEEMYFVPEFHVEMKKAAPQKSEGKGGRGKGRGGRGDRGGKGGKDGKPKESPWGLSPEEKAAKTAKGGGGKPAKS